MPSLETSEVAVVARDGDEIYVFDGWRHVRTLHPLTGESLASLSYEGDLLAAVTDGDGNTTAIERDAQGAPTAIVGPYGHRTLVGLDASGYLDNVTNPAGESHQMSNTADGLLTVFTQPEGYTTGYEYGPDGRLIHVNDATNGSQTLSRAGSQSSFTVTKTSATGRSTTYAVESMPDGSRSRVTTFADGTAITTDEQQDGRLSVEYPDGTIVTLTRGPDPRWGMQAPLVIEEVIQTPAGTSRTTTLSRTVTLNDPVDLLSLVTQTDVAVRNGSAATSTYTAATRTLTATSAEGRMYEMTLDQLGRPLHERVGDLYGTTYTYDSAGRLVMMSAGEPGASRTWTMSYGADGLIDSVVDSLGRSWAFTRDAVGRIIEQSLPGDRSVISSFDSNGNVTTLAPPGRPEHTMTYTATNRPSTYTPPVVGPAPQTTTLRIRPRPSDYTGDQAGRPHHRCHLRRCRATRRIRDSRRTDRIQIWRRDRIARRSSGT